MLPEWENKDSTDSLGPEDFIGKFLAKEQHIFLHILDIKQSGQ